MHIAIYLPLLSAAALGLAARWIADRLPPAVATWTLVLTALVSAAASSFVLAVLAFTLAGRFDLVASLGHWSTATLAASSPVPPVVAGLAGVGVVVLAVACAVALITRVRSLLAARRLCHQLGGSPGQLLILDTDDIEACAIPTAGGRILISQPFLQALTGAERRIVLAHESAHLAHHHHVHRIAADLAAAVNPMLRPVALAVRYTTERWADEHAVATVGDRMLVARSLARTALLSRPTAHGRDWQAVSLSAHGCEVAPRVQQLLRPKPGIRPVALLMVTALLGVSLLASLETKQDTERLFERAMRVSAAATAHDDSLR